MRIPNFSIFIGCVFFLGFVALSKYISPQRLVADDLKSIDRIVISAPVLSALYVGDRFLAANLEIIRLTATGMDSGRIDNRYLIRAQNEVARLNPCHEDNYYLANGLLAWGGADREAGSVLRRATNCRFWDELPPFFYGFNQFFFEHDLNAAQDYLELAAQRSKENSAALRKFSIMVKAEEFQDERLALEFLQVEHDRASEPQLKAMLAKRVIRLQGLVTLRDAQRRYEQQLGKKLTEPQQLLDAGILNVFPQDPLGLGYELINDRVMLKKLRVTGIEEQP